METGSYVISRRVSGVYYLNGFPSGAFDTPNSPGSNGPRAGHIREEARILSCHVIWSLVSSLEVRKTKGGKKRRSYILWYILCDNRLEWESN